MIIVRIGDNRLTSLPAFRSECGRKLEDLGDLGMDAGRPDEAILRYSAAHSLNPTDPSLLGKRSSARAKMGSWNDALHDADEVCHLCLVPDSLP